MAPDGNEEASGGAENHGGVTFTAPGAVVLDPAMADLAARLDGLFSAEAARDGAAAWGVPMFVTEDTLRRAGYLASFPHHVISCAPATDPEAIRSPSSAFAPGAFAHDGLFLTPAACLHMYAARAGAVHDSPAIATFLAPCARHEPGSTADPARLWSYNVREVVIVGDAAAAGGFFERWTEALRQIGRSFGLPCEVRQATDAFFGPDAQDHVRFQERLRSKYELVGSMPDGAEVALASTNRHDTHFGAGFGISCRGHVAHSACVGFGIERWVAWVVSHCGPSPAGWPQVLRG